MKKKTSLGLLTFLSALVLFVIMRIQFEQLKVHRSPRVLDNRDQQQLTFERSNLRTRLTELPRGMVESTSDMEMKTFWQSSRLKENRNNCSALLAMAVGIPQKRSVDSIVRKFVAENYSVVLFHYDGNVDSWHDFDWSSKAIHILARNQTKWWFAKRFLHPDVVSAYDYIFLWDEDIGVEKFHPGRYLRIMMSEELEITQPALDPDRSYDIHHRITVRNRRKKVHRRIYVSQGSLNCTEESTGPPCTGWIEGMAPVFSRAAWRCVWHLIQNDLIHGWGLDMKLGYCAQGDRTKKVGVIDSEYIVHQGIPSLGGSSSRVQAPSHRSFDLRTQIRRQSTAELDKFKERWNKAVREDEHWVDPFDNSRRKQ